MRNEEGDWMLQKAILGLMLVVLLSACEIFILPEAARNNPNDPENPVKAALEFRAIGISSTQIELSWRVESGDPSFQIIRKKGQDLPINQYDGRSVDMGNLQHDPLTNSYTLIDTLDPYDPDRPEEFPSHYAYRLWTTDGKDHYTDSGAKIADLLD